MRHLLRRLRLGAKNENGDHWFNSKAVITGQLQSQLPLLFVVKP